MSQRWAPIRLDLGVPGVSPPAAAVEAAAASLRAPAAYGPPGGLPDLRAALAAKVRTRNGIPATTDRVLVTTGASMAITAVLAAHAVPDRPVLIPDPGFPSFAAAAELLRLPVTRYPADRPDTIAELERLAARARPSAILWNSPLNPTGAVASAGQVEAVVALAERHGVPLISDEVYEDFVFEGRHLSPASLDSGAGVYTVFSFSKTLALAGWRGGYVVAPADGVQAVERAHWALAMGAPLPVQAAALATLGAPVAERGHLGALRRRLREQRERALAALDAAAIPVRRPQGGFFLWPRTEPVIDGERFARLAAERCGVVVQPGAIFGPAGAGHVRLSVAGDPAELGEALGRLDGLWQTLRREPARAC